MQTPICALQHKISDVNQPQPFLLHSVNSSVSERDTKRESIDSLKRKTIKKYPFDKAFYIKTHSWHFCWHRDQF